MDRIIKNTSIALRLTAKQLQEVDRLRDSGLFSSRAEVCRYIIQDYINVTAKKKQDAKIDDIKGIF